MYKDKMHAPMTWHGFTRWIRVPFGVLSAISAITQYEQASLDLLSWVQVYLIVEMIIFEIGAGKWKRSSYQAIIRLETVNLITAAIIAMVQGIDGLAFAVGKSIIPIIDLIYYKKRKLLFDDIKWDPLIDTVHVCPKCGNIQSGLIDKEYDCKECGEKTLNTNRTVHSWNLLEKNDQNAIFEDIKNKNHMFVNVQTIDISKNDSNDNFKESNVKEIIIHEEADNNINEKSEQILYCRKCGTKLDSDARFCRKCGTEVKLNEKM